MSIIQLDFKGYYSEDKLPLSLQSSGIYIVYSGKKTGEKECKLSRLLYVGESKNVSSRVGTEHEKYSEWIAYLDDDEILYFSFAEILSTNRERAEAALIFYHQPLCNEQNKETFDYSTTRIKTSGRNALLSNDFTVPDEDD